VQLVSNDIVICGRLVKRFNPALTQILLKLLSPSKKSSLPQAFLDLAE
jgi:hypothetical protein